MLEFFRILAGFVAGVWHVVFESMALEIGPYNVTYGGLIFAFLVIGLTINVFWKGART